jgi:hypothetical protein
LLAGAEQGSGLINATLSCVGALGGGDVAGVIPLHAVGELAEEYAGLLIGRGRGGEVGGEGHLLRVSAMVRVTRMGSSPFSQRVCPQQVVRARPGPARWPGPRTSRSMAAGSRAGAGGRCWRRAQGACSVNLAVVLSARAVAREAL